MKVSLTDVGLEAASLVYPVPRPPGSGEHKASHVRCMCHSGVSTVLRIPTHCHRHSVLKVTPLTVCFILPGDAGIAEIYINLLFSLSNVNLTRPQQRISGLQDVQLI